MPNTFVKVLSLPACDFCGDTATYDSRTIFGSWGYTCDTCQDTYGLRPLGLQLGTGNGQRLVLAD